MGLKLKKIFEIVEEQGGTSKRLQFAEIVKMTKSKALETEDTPEYINYFKNVAEKLLDQKINI